MPGAASSPSARPSWRARLECWLVDGWTRRGLVYWLFLDLSWLAGRIARRRRARFLSAHPKKPAVPVVVVGNLIAGGAGKTPIVIALVEALRARGRRPGVIARGYRAHAAGVQAVQADGDPAEAGDEPVLIAARTGAPVYVGAQRAAAARALCEAHPEVDVIVSDDGLQHYALARTVELVVFDARGTGNGAFLPAGPLREPLDRPRDATLFSGCPVDPALAAGAPTFGVAVEAQALLPLSAYARRAAAARTATDANSDASAATDADAGANAGTYTAAAAVTDVPAAAGPHTGARDAAAEPPAALAGRRVAAYAGIAHPDKFFALLRALGAEVEAHPLPDHAHFSPDTFANTDAALVVITEKDAVKCAQLPALAGNARIRVLRIGAGLDAALIDLIMEKLDGPQAA